MGLGLALAGCLTACDGQRGDGKPARSDATGEALPAPQGAAGSVTGMPGQPGPGQVGTPEPAVDEALPPPLFDSEGNPVDPALVDGLPTPPGTTLGTLPSAAPDPVVADGPGPDEAVALVGSYYGAINAGSYGQAYALWSDGGGASGQSPQQFADGFDDTAEVSVEIMAPGRIGAAAGSRFIEVPVAVSATRDDGSVHKYVGNYTLRRAVVDGATPEQRTWRIASADLREVQP